MATIRKRGDKWQVQVRRKGRPLISRSFIHNADARKWARQMETEADRAGLPVDSRQLRGLTVADLIERYKNTVTVRKRGCVQETERLNLMLRRPFASVPLSDLTASLFSAYRDERLGRCRPETVRRELALIQHVFEVARQEWSVSLNENPVASIRKPTTSPPRDRRLHDDETRLLDAASRSRNPYIAPIVRLAIETGMRRGELLGATWDDVDLDNRTLHLRQTKNGHPRTVPLSTEAMGILRGLPASDDPRVLPVSVNAFRLAWRRVQKRAGVQDLHFHDLRHEAINRFFERGLSVPEVALISGHRDPRMLFRYTHLRAEDVAAKLR